MATAKVHFPADFTTLTSTDSRRHFSLEYLSVADIIVLKIQLVINCLSWSVVIGGHPSST